MLKKNPHDTSRQEKKVYFNEVLDTVFSRTSSTWSTLAEKTMLATSKEAYLKVPAYKDFLIRSGFSFTEKNSSDIFKTLPILSKKKYLRAYPWKDLCKQGVLAKESLVMTSTSGSTGEPFYFPRTQIIDLQSSIYHQMFLRTSNALSEKKKTLVIDCFGMGVWIGGLITYQAFSYIAERGYPLTIITPGINKQEIFKSLKNIGKEYDQIILCGYPPFIKDIVDEAPLFGVQWRDYSLKIIFAAESFSETFRDYIVEKTGIKNIYRDTMNIYGSADLGTMAQETPLSILLRRIALTNQKLHLRLFGQNTRLPTFAQYIPLYTNFEAKKGSIFCTGDNALPLVRYEIGDNGSVMTYNEVRDICAAEGVDIHRELIKAGLEDTKTELPFVSVYERSDFSSSFYGALIYPEFIKKALADKKLEDFLTGKFTMITKNDDHEDQYLEITLEMKVGQKVSQKTKLDTFKSIYSTLMEQSAEFKKIVESLGKKSFPRLVFLPYGDQGHFVSGAKQKWIKKSVV
jgi:phenylacetate-CoA ligase